MTVSLAEVNDAIYSESSSFRNHSCDLNVQFITCHKVNASSRFLAIYTNCKVTLLFAEPKLDCFSLK